MHRGADGIAPGRAPILTDLSERGEATALLFFGIIGLRVDPKDLHPLINFAGAERARAAFAVGAHRRTVRCLQFAGKLVGGYNLDAPDARLPRYRPVRGNHLPLTGAPDCADAPDQQFIGVAGGFGKVALDIIAVEVLRVAVHPMIKHNDDAPSALPGRILPQQQNQLRFIIAVGQIQIRHLSNQVVPIDKQWHTLDCTTHTQVVTAVCNNYSQTRVPSANDFLTEARIPWRKPVDRRIYVSVCPYTDRCESITMPGTDIYEQPVQPDEQAYRRNYRQDQARRWGSVLLLVGIIWLVFELVSHTLFLGSGFGFVERTQRLEETVTGEALVVDVVGDDVSLVRGNGPEMQIEVVKHAFGWNGAAAERALADLDLTIDEHGNSVHITGPRTTGFFIGRRPYVSLNIALPTDTQFTITTTNGDLLLADVTGDGTLETTNGTISGEDTRGTLTLKTTNGDIELERHHGSLVIETINGDVTAEEGRITRVVADSVNGDFTFVGITGLLDVTTVAGDIDIEDARAIQLDLESTSGDLEFAGSLAATGPQRVTSIAGDITLRLPASVSLQLDVGTLSGEIETDLELQQATYERRQVRGRLGTGDTLLHVNTTSGDIDIAAD